MPRAIVARTGWSAGEWSPRLYSRFDLDAYPRALKRCENFIVTPHGALARRPPTRYVGDTNGTGDVVLLPFIARYGAYYVVELGDRYFQVWTEDGKVYGPVTTPYTAADLKDIGWAQYADVMYVVHPSYPPYQIRRTSTAPAFDIVPVTFLNGRAPLMPLNFETTKTATLSGTWPNLTITMSANTFIAADVGRVFFARDPVAKKAAYITITSVASPTSATGTGTHVVGGGYPTGALVDWALGAFSSSRGCRSVVIHESRLWYGGFADAPDLVVSSVSSSFDNFETISPDPTAGDAANADKSIARRVGGEVMWMASGAGALYIGTPYGEVTLEPGVSGSLTPTETAVRPVSVRGSAPVRPVEIDETLFFVQRDRTRLRQLRFSVESNTVVAADATLMAHHMTSGRIARMAYQQSPWSCLWFLDDRGELYGLTIEVGQNVASAHRHRLGGGFRGRAPVVLDIACVPAKSGGDALFLAVRRTHGGNVVQTVEVLAAQPDIVDDASPPERQIYSVERMPYIDSLRSTYVTTYTITAASDDGTGVKFSYSGSANPANGTQIVFRGLAWRVGQEIVSYTAMTREIFVVLAVDTTAKTFKIARPEAPTEPIGLDDYELPSNAVLATDIDRLQPIATTVVTSVPAAGAENGDEFVYVADGRYVDGPELSPPASLVHGGYRYTSRFTTLPVHLARAEAPTDAGEPAVPSRITLRMWATIGGWIRIGLGDDVQQIVTSSTTELMDAPPRPIYVDRTIPVGGSWQDGGFVTVETDDPYPMEVLGMFVNLKTSPR